MAPPTNVSFCDDASNSDSTIIAIANAAATPKPTSLVNRSLAIVIQIIFFSFSLSIASADVAANDPATKTSFYPCCARVGCELWHKSDRFSQKNCLFSIFLNF
jgi:hypothetical protein